MPWIMAAAVLVLPVVLRLFAEPDNPGNGAEHYSGDPDASEDEPGGMLAAA